jgi:hypothetical protein
VRQEFDAFIRRLVIACKDQEERDFIELLIGRLWLEWQGRKNVRKLVSYLNREEGAEL